ncbi:uncharacterized protein C13orf42 homolog [Sphaerodactylus townsendi]|uniref:uncharacterized protein C13orf42 homolog n=1 Tax=Sphaerodactylus townsendi TaxID=933632 RepID=UPI00202611F3|nr:uncharacterized protein C13orf42 homolog [Sphaerodactylus townsendi]
MIRKIHSIFHPNSRQRSLIDGIPVHEGSEVRLIRSTSMYVLGGEDQEFRVPLKKCKSTTSIDSAACIHLKEEERAWMYSKTQDCLQYLQDLLALRKKYIESIKDLKSMDKAHEISPVSTKSSKTGKKPQATVSSTQSSKKSAERKTSQLASDVREAIAYFDSIIAELDAERQRKIVVRDYRHADVDFEVVTSSREHSLHSNWILRAPRKQSQDIAQESRKSSQSEKKNQERTINSRKKIERYPIYLPKAVEGAFNTLKFKPKMSPKEQL